MSEAAPTPAGAPGGHRAGKNTVFALGALAVAAAAFLVLAYGRIGENLIYYWGPKELRAAGQKAIGATIRLGGMVVAGSVKRGQGSELEFEVEDGQARVRVVSRSVPPQMFREGIGVVVEGTMTRDGHFESRRLMISHDNSYRAPADKQKADVREMMRSVQGLDDAKGQEKR